MSDLTPTDGGVTQQMIWGAVRTLIAFGAGLAVRQGVLDTSTAVELVGAVMILLPLAWSAWEKRWQERQTQRRLHEAVKAGVVEERSGRLDNIPAAAIGLNHAQEIITNLKEKTSWD